MGTQASEGRREPTPFPTSCNWASQGMGEEAESQEQPRGSFRDALSKVGPR